MLRRGNCPCWKQTFRHRTREGYGRPTFLRVRTLASPAMYNGHGPATGGPITEKSGSCRSLSLENPGLANELWQTTSGGLNSSLI